MGVESGVERSCKVFSSLGSPLRGYIYIYITYLHIYIYTPKTSVILRILASCWLALDSCAGFMV